MTLTAMSTDRIAIDDAAVKHARGAIGEARALLSPEGATLTLRTAEGIELALPDDLQRILLRVLNAIAEDDSVAIGRMPEELTSTVAADLLGVSRPTLMKLAKNGEIPSFKVGTHTRFKRDDILVARAARAKKRHAAIDDLRAFEAEHAELLDG